MDKRQAVIFKEIPVTAKIINFIMGLKPQSGLFGLGRTFVCRRAGKSGFFWLKFFILTLGLPASVAAFAVGNASGTYYQGDGVVWSNSDPLVAKWTTGHRLSCDTNARGGILISRTSLNWGSAGGYYGIVIAPDVILSLQGTAHFDGKTDSREYLRLKWYFYYRSSPSTTGSYYFSSKGGTVVNSFENSVANNGDAYLRAYPSDVNSGTQMTIYSETTMATQLYVGPNASPGTYSLPQLSFQYGCYVNNTQILTASTITIKKRELSCSISSPSVIDFGSVNVRGRSDGDVLGVRNGNLTVSCSNQGKSSATANVSVTGDKGRYTNTLKMALTGVSSEAPAEIRGFIGPSIPQTGICDGNNSYTGWIQFTNATQAIPLGTLKSGSNSIPYSFSLCSTGGNNGGQASATATINLSWD